MKTRRPVIFFLVKDIYIEIISRQLIDAAVEVNVH